MSLSPFEIDCFDWDYSHREISRKLFLKAKTWKELVQLWVQFYANAICLPTYGSTWVGPDSGNSLATFEIGKRLANISLKSGLLFDDGQQASSSRQQREYLSGFTIASYEPVIRKICEKMNQISGMVAFYWVEDYFKQYKGIIDLDNAIQGLYVTYDNYDKIESLDDSWIGVASTHMPNTNEGPYSLFKDESWPGYKPWLNNTFGKQLKEEGFIGFNFMDTIHGQGRIIPLLESILW